MNISRFTSTLVLLCLFFFAQRVDAQCDIIITIETTNISCSGLSNGSFEIITSGATGPNTFIWSNGNTDEDISGLSAGVYTVTVTDDLGCTASATGTITDPMTVLNLVLNDDGIINCQNISSEIVPDIDGGVLPYNFLWSTGATTDVYSTLEAGTFTLTVTDDNGCSISASKTINVSPTYPVADAGPDDFFATCATAPNMLGGPGTSIGPNFLYEWTTFQGVIDPGVDIHQPFIEVTEFGSYSLTVTSIAEGCSNQDMTIVSGALGFPNVTIQVPPNLNCQTPQVTLNATGSSTGPQYTYLWSTTNGHIVSGANTLTPVVDAPGNYILKITDTQQGCNKKRQITVAGIPGSHVANAGPDTGIPCGGAQVTLDGTNSSTGAQYTHFWTTSDGNILANANTINPIVNQPGTYTLVVTNILTGCTQTDDVKVFPGPAIPSTDFSLLDVSCTGQLGIAGVNMTQGSGPYTYLWSNGSTEAAIINIFQGTYSVVVTDATGCDYYGEVEIKDTSTLTLSAQTTAPSCNPGNNGAIDLTNTGLFGPFTYAWNTGETTQDLSNLSGGAYTVTVTYAGGTCTQTLSVTVTDTTSMALSTVVTDANPCLGINGFIDLTVNGGTPPFIYTWSDGEAAQDASPISFGPFIVTVSDALGCTKTTSATINEVFNLNVNLVASGPISCQNQTVELTPDVSGGILPYTFLWSTGATTNVLSVAAAGIYSLTVSDAGNCQHSTQINVVLSPGYPVADAGPANVLVTCATAPHILGGAGTSIGPDFTYQWETTNGSIDPGVDPTQAFLEVTQSGTYTLIVTNITEGCSATSIPVVVVQDGSFPVFSAQTPPQLNCANTKVILNATGSSTGPQYSYLWTSANGHIELGANSLTPLVDEPGDYILSITNNQEGCTKKGLVTVVADPNVLTANAGPDKGIPCGGGQVTLDGSASIGAQYAYQWSKTTINGNIVSGANTLHPVVDEPGKYKLSVFDTQNACIKEDVVTVFSGPIIPVQDSYVVDVSCTGQLGEAGVNMTQGTGPYTYLWSTGSTNSNVINVLAGTYTVTVTDATGCDYFAVLVVGEDHSNVSLSTVVTSKDCTGGIGGTIDLSVTGISSPISYAWGLGETTQDLTGLGQGTYYVTVSYAFGACSIITSAYVDQINTNIQLSTQITNDDCAGACTGSIDLTVTGGTMPYQYFWGTGSPTQDVSNLCPGYYFLTVSDAAGCRETKISYVDNLASNMVATATATAANCFVIDGAIDLSITGGIPPYTYSWAGGETTQDLAGLSAGTYTVTVTDANACTKTVSVTVDLAIQLDISAVVTASTSCAFSDGAINLSVTPSGSYTYLWSDGTTTEDITNALVGNYTVTVSAGGLCTANETFTVPFEPNLPIPTAIPNATSCDLSNGNINASVTGGVAPYVYLWSNGATTQDLSNIISGLYWLTVTGANGCTNTISVDVTNSNQAITVNGIITPNTVCVGNPNGSIDVSVAPTGVYTYNWSNGATTQDLSNLVTGDYTITVSAGGSCTQMATFNVPDNSNTLIITATVTNASCNGNDGGIDITVTGGTPVFSYAWSNGHNVQDCFLLFAGTYTVTVMDAVGCTKTASAIVGQNSSVVLSTTVINASCSGACDGSIDLTATNGIPPYNYIWSDGSTLQDLNNLCAGVYTITVVDATGCTQTTSATVSQTINIIANVTVNNVSCNGGNNGSVDLTVTGGAPGYTYLWSNAATTQDLSGLVAGTYTVTVTDNNGCTKTTSAIITQPTAINVTETHVNVLCNGGNNGSVDLTVIGGAPGYTYLWSNSATTEDMSGLVAGTYSVTVTDNNGCTKTRSSTITEPTQLNLTTTVNTVSCFGGNDGAINLTISGGVAPYVYAWSNTATTQDLSSLIAGIYTVTVTDANNCTRSSILPVSQPTQVIFSIVSLSNTCSSETITGPNLPNTTYQWFGPNGFTSTTAAITANFSGVYSLTITNANGCTASNNYTVNLSGTGACGAVKGRVFHDEDESCSLNGGEPGLAGWIVRAEGANDTLYGVTNAQGQYLVGVPVGTYAVKVFVPNGLWTICPGGIFATVGMAGDTVSGGDFPVQSTYICPALTVSLGTNQLRRCFSNNFYEVEYCNQGTQAAQDAYITVALDPFLTPMSSSIPYTDQGANVLRFEVGDIAIGECGTFNIQVFVNCNAVLGQTHCTQASIYPDTLCAPTNTNWSGASLSIQSACSNDSLRFIIRNDGKATMSTTREYIVVEDGIMFRSGILPPLVENDSMIIAVEANGSTWRVEVDQELFHPYASPLGLSVEGCATASFSTGFVNQFPTPDEPPTVDIDCTANKGSFDPNDKHSYPVGYGADHYVRPGTDIEYLIRFQNTGSDTAFTVQIIDTLSAWLDPATIRLGASSHPYQFDLNGEGVVHFLFEDIFLPDSNTNEAASHGFAKFIIKPRLDAPLETLIENTAAIYFDFNDPVFTNTTFLRLGNNFITVGVWQPVVPEAKVVAVPNPFYDQTVLEVKGLARSTGLRLQVFDLQGNVVREMESENVFFYLRKADWQSGIYLFKITQNGRLVGSGKLMAE